MVSVSRLRKVVDPRFMAFRAQRAIRDAGLRDRIGGWVSRWKQPAAHDRFLDPAMAGQLRSNGVCWLGTVLDMGQVADVRRMLEDRPVRNFYRPEDGTFLPLSDGRHPESHVANHSLEDVLVAPHLLPLANRPEILALVEEHLGCMPTITSFSAWWSYPTPIGPQHAELFHRDVDDWRFCKLFVYLTDVNAEQGPHVYVARSAQSGALRDIRRLADEEVAEAFGGKSLRTLTGSAGSAFLEDTSGIHKGTPVRSGRRLLFQAVYGLMPLPDMTRTPIVGRAAMEKLHGVAFNPYVNRFLLS